MQCIICGTIEAVVLIEDNNGEITPICEKCIYTEGDDGKLLKEVGN